MSGWTLRCLEKLLGLPGSNGSNSILFIGMVNGANDAFVADAFINKLDNKAEGIFIKFAFSTKWKMLCMLEVCAPIQRKLEKLNKLSTGTSSAAMENIESIQDSN